MRWRMRWQITLIGWSVNSDDAVSTWQKKAHSVFFYGRGCHGLRLVVSKGFNGGLTRCMWGLSGWDGCAFALFDFKVICLA